MPEKKNVIIYTDGACINNPGPGGYGAVLIYGHYRKEISGGFRKTTNNRMEIYAAIASLRLLKERCSVAIYSDSQYLVDAIMKGWAKRWRSLGWKRNKKDLAINPDLWDELLNLCEHHMVSFHWVRGHSGNVENECCDGLATKAAKEKNLPIDQGYENASSITVTTTSLLNGF
jgi:ribonuclease HI